MSIQQEICAWCWDDRQIEVPSYTVIALVPLCVHCAKGTGSQQRNNAKRQPHIPAKAILAPTIVPKREYVKRHGNPGRAQFTARTLAFWERIESLSFDDILVLPIRDEETSNQARSRYWNVVNRIRKVMKPSYRIHIQANAKAGHVTFQKTRE